MTSKIRGGAKLTGTRIHLKTEDSQRLLGGLDIFLSTWIQFSDRHLLSLVGKREGCMLAM